MKKEKTTLIKPKRIKEKELENKKFLGPILMFIIGLILLTDSSKIVIIGCYIIGAVIILIGIYNLISYYKLKKELKVEDNQKLVIGATTIFIGIVILILSGAIETFLRFIIGFILICNGIKNTIYALHDRNYITLIIGIILIGMGMYTILAQNIIFQIIGALLIISSIMDFINLWKNTKK